jgi:UPF0716 protein FxsA
MFMALIVLFVAMPLIEIAVLLKVHSELGMGSTILIVFLTGILGASLARWQGHKAIMEIQRDMAEGRVPAPHIIDGLMIFAAGVVLLTPGLVTDAIGFLILIPIVRREIRVWVRRWIEKKIASGSIQVRTYRD